MATALPADTSTALHADIEVVEAGYEFLLAYAAQGRERDDGQGPRARDTLNAMDAAMARLSTLLKGSELPFSAVVIDDIGKSRAALGLVLSAAQIGSELIDNLNASIHLRAVLTDLFLLSEVNASGSRR
jgi:hypothetical protein